MNSDKDFLSDQQPEDGAIFLHAKVGPQVPYPITVYAIPVNAVVSVRLECVNCGCFTETDVARLQNSRCPDSCPHCHVSYRYQAGAEKAIRDLGDALRTLRQDVTAGVVRVKLVLPEMKEE
jgi:hypothetical protein